MPPRRVLCPRCHRPADLPADARFCPHCGQDGLVASPPETLAVDGTPFVVGRQVGVGRSCNVYACRVEDGRLGTGNRVGVFKIARDAAGDARLRAAVARLAALNGDGGLRPFVPEVFASLAYRAGDAPVARAAAVLVYHEAAADAGAWYSLEEVRAEYPRGIDARDTAWIWRRLLTALAGVHARGLVHAAVTPAHVLIAPGDHGVLLAGWGAATPVAAALRPPTAYRDWYAPPTGVEQLTAAAALPPTATPAIDLRTAARTMLALLAQPLPDPPPLEPALGRYFDRVIAAGPDTTAARLLDDFDRLIDTLWGPRQFRPFAMPPRESV